MINVQHFQLFPTLVASYSDLLTDQEITFLKNSCLQFDNADLEKSAAFTDEKSYSTHKVNESSAAFNFLYKLQHNHIYCNNITDKIDKCIKDYTNTFGLPNIRIVQSWFNIQNKGSVLKEHIHELSVLSGVLYVNVDSKSSPIYFSNPLQSQLQNFKVSTQTEMNLHKYWFQPKNGMLLIFPSWLSHGSNFEENNTDGRIAISFNTWY